MDLCHMYMCMKTWMFGVCGGEAWWTVRYLRDFWYVDSSSKQLCRISYTYR